MAQYTYKVELETNTGFILDTDKLDTGTLGYLLQDVTQYVRSVSTRRGKSTLQGKFTAGQMTVVFDNRSRAFDPKYTSSPYNGSIVPRRRIIFSMGDASNPGAVVQQFTGWIDDWNLSYDVSGESTSTAQCSDAFTILANQNVNLTGLTAESSSVRITRVLNASSVQWPSDKTQIGAGAFQIGTATYNGNALDYMQSVSDSEAAYLFINSYGELTYMGWNSLAFFSSQSPDASFSTTPGTALPINALEVVYGTEELVNNATVSGAAGTVTVQDTTSQQTYRIASESYPSLVSTVGEMTTLGNFYITNYANPKYRISQLEVSADNPVIKSFAGPLLNGLFGFFFLDIGNVVSVEWTPNSIGSAITQKSFITGIDIDATPESCTYRFAISGEDTRDAYVSLF
jgi:hypothetical protein